ncbi:hypothetical protein fsci_19140 [Francisella sciaenopsi]|uniref:Uncharacterized protein n=1 Tax=Francisella sciaenopsi TaxID=3055034 RepID=A0ABQ6PHH4_9GAMM
MFDFALKKIFIELQKDYLVSSYQLKLLLMVTYKIRPKSVFLRNLRSKRKEFKIIESRASSKCIRYYF